MKDRNFVGYSLMLALLGLFVWSFAVGAEGPDKGKRGKESLSKGAGTPRYQILNINNLTTWHRSDGHSNHSPQADNGVYYPRGTANVIYQDCIVWGGKMYTGGFPGSGGVGDANQLVRVGGGSYGIGTRAGKVIGFGATAQAEDPNLPEVRIYRIRRDYYTLKDADGNPTQELIRDAAESNEVPEDGVTDGMISDVYDQYHTDWTNWPVSRGAPFIDRNGNGTYDPPPPFSAGFNADSLITQGWDEPGVAGIDPNSPADQVLWTVYNDLTVSQALGFASSEPVGLEVQKTLWGYKRTDALGNLYFQRHKFINTGGPHVGTSGGTFYIDSMYICQWSDPDLGSFSDDLLGCDSTLSIGYVYNGNPVDDTFRRFNLAPAVAAYDFLAGPIIPSANDTAVFDLKYLPGYKNLGMSSFAYFSAGSPYSDPPNNVPAGYAGTTGQWWKMLRGFAPLGTISDPDQPYAHPPGFAISKYPLSGDPVAGDVFVDGKGQSWSFAPGDRRLLCITGPFQMAPADTQEITVGFVVGLGSDRLSSVTVMKFNDLFVQNTYDALFQVPKPPPAPVVQVAELDGEIVLNWSNDKISIDNIEGGIANPGQFEFEGYNVYQLPSRGARLSESKRIVTYDLPTDPAVILDLQVDEESGQVLSKPVQFGSNSGILRKFVFNRDYILDVDKIYYGQEYYLAVTSYSHAKQANFLPAALESDVVVLTVRAKDPFGKTIAYSYGDTVTVSHDAGISDGNVLPLVMDPSGLTGQTYTVTFDTTGGTVTWSLARGTTTLLSGQDNQTGDENYLVVDGMMVKVTGPPPTYKDFIYVADENGPIVPPGYAAFGFDGDYPDPRGASPGGGPTPGSWGFALSDANRSFSRFVARSTQYSGGLGEPDQGLSALLPDDYEWRFTATGGQALSAFGTATDGTMMSVPFELWNTQGNSDPSDDFRLFCLILDNNENGVFDLSGNDNVVSGGSNDPETDLMYMVQPLDETPGTAGYDALVTQVSADPNAAVSATLWAYKDATYNTKPALMRLVLVTWNGGDVTDPSFPANVAEPMPPTGTILKIALTKPNEVADVFTFTPPAPASGKEVEMASTEKVLVYPNPYYAFNPAETNRFARFVTFNNLPPQATIRIFNLAGQLVRKIEKNGPSQFQQWDLLNKDNLPVASGMYIAYVEMTLPTDGSKVTKTLKFAIIQEQEILNSY